MLNVVAIMGRLVADPELRTTPQGTNVCSFRIACDRNFVRQGGQRQAGAVGHLLFFVAVVPALADDVDPQEGEEKKARRLVPGGNVLVDGTRKQEAQHGHQELSRPGGHGKLDAVAQAFLLNEQAVGERHDKGVYGQGESQE